MAQATLTSNPALDEMIAKAKAQEDEINNLKAQLAAASSPKALTVSMSDYGAGTISVKGLNRFPVSLHPEQWISLHKFLNTQAVENFIRDNSDKLRIARFSAAYAAKLGKKWPAGKSKTDPEAMDYMRVYNAGKMIAESDKTLDAVRG